MGLGRKAEGDLTVDAPGWPQLTGLCLHTAQGGAAAIGPDVEAEARSTAWEALSPHSRTVRGQHRQSNDSLQGKGKGRVWAVRGP